MLNVTQRIVKIALLLPDVVGVRVQEPVYQELMPQCLLTAHAIIPPKAGFTVSVVLLPVHRTSTVRLVQRHRFVDIAILRQVDVCWEIKHNLPMELAFMMTLAPIIGSSQPALLHVMLIALI